MRKKAVLGVDLDPELDSNIQHLVKNGRFKSRDDFIELACAEKLVRLRPDKTASSKD